MFNALMKVQWKWTRAAVLVATVIGFSIPMWAARFMDPRNYFYDMSRISPGYVIRGMQEMGVLYAVLAGASGLFVAFLAWSADHKGRHLYALSLPVSRGRYALMRFGAGALFLLIPAAGVLLGCLVATSVMTIPDGMHAYPLQVAIRFVLSCFVAFSIFFAVAASSRQASAVMLGAIAGFFLVAVVVSAMGVRTDIFGTAMKLIFAEPGVLSIFTGRWMLVDV